MDRSTSAYSRVGFPPTDRDGITLIEVLVCLMLLSLLAAAVFPVVTQRVSRAEPLVAMQQLNVIEAAIEAFAADLGGTYPGDLDDLGARIDPDDKGVRRDSGRVAFDQDEQDRWAGPYVDNELVQGGSLTTGFGVPIRDDLIRYDASNGSPDGGAGFRLQDSLLFLAVQIGSAGRQLTVAQFEAINDLIDGPGEPDGPGPNTSWSQGRLRFDNVLVPADSVAYYLAVQIER